MSLVRLAADEPRRARSETRQVMAQWSQDEFHVQHFNQLLAQIHINRYVGNGSAALKRFRSRERAFSWSFLGRVQFLRIAVFVMGAFSALAVALQGNERAGLLRKVEFYASRLRHERIPYAFAFGEYVEAAVAFQRGNRSEAVKLLTNAIDAFEAVDMGLNAAAARRRLGQLIGGAEGQAHIDQADKWMTDQEIRNPMRMTRAYAPGFPD